MLHNHYSVYLEDGIRNWCEKWLENRTTLGSHVTSTVPLYSSIRRQVASLVTFSWNRCHSSGASTQVTEPLEGKKQTSNIMHLSMQSLVWHPSSASTMCMPGHFDGMPGFSRLWCHQHLWLPSTHKLVRVSACRIVALCVDGPLWYTISEWGHLA